MESTETTSVRETGEMCLWEIVKWQAKEERLRVKARLVERCSIIRNTGGFDRLLMQCLKIWLGQMSREY